MPDYDGHVPRVLAPLVCALVALVLCVTPPYRAASQDTSPGFLGAPVLACQGNQDLAHMPVVVAQVQRNGLPYWVTVTPDGHGLVSTFGPAPAWLARAAFIGVRPGDTLDTTRMQLRTRWASGAAIGLAAALLCLAALAWTRVAVAVAAGVVAACSFAGAPVLGQDPWQQTAALPALMGALAAVAWTERSRVAAVVAPALALLAVAIRPADAPLSLGLLAAWATLLPRADRAGVRRDVALAALAAAILVSPLIVWNLVHVGTPWPRGQWVSNSAAHAGVFELSPKWIAGAFAGLLVSPGRGLLFFAPVALVGIGTAFRARARALLALGIVLQILFCASFFRWTGGVSFGPRLLAGAAWIAIGLAAASFDELGLRARVAVIGAASITALVGLLGCYAFDLRQWEFGNKLEEHPERAWQLADSAWTHLFTRVPEPPPSKAPAAKVVFCPDGPSGRWAVDVR